MYGADPVWFGVEEVSEFWGRAAFNFGISTRLRGESSSTNTTKEDIYQLDVLRKETVISEPKITQRTQSSCFLRKSDLDSDSRADNGGRTSPLCFWRPRVFWVVVGGGGRWPCSNRAGQLRACVLHCTVHREHPASPIGRLMRTLVWF